ncbi:MAG: OmpP1/FadL family transporter [Acidobacteriota bacterium]
MRMRGLVGVLLLLAATGAFASGTQVYEQGSKASALAGAFVAQADDPSAVFYNPAGMAFQKGMNLSFNLTYIRADVKHLSPTYGTFQNNAKNFFLPSFFFTMPINDKITFGLSNTAPFNLATDWADDFNGRFAGRHSKIVTFQVRPAVSFKLDDHNAVAIGLDYYDSEINLIRSANTSAISTAINPHRLPSPPFPPGIPFYRFSEVSLDTHVRDQALGWNVSYMGQWDHLSLGLFYHSKAKFDYDGHVSFEVPASLRSVSYLFPGQGVNLSLTSVPASARLGLGYKWDKWRAEVDLNWTQWSTWGTAPAHFQKPTSFHGSPVVANETFVFNWKDGYTYRVGASYQYSDHYTINFGALYDETAIGNNERSPLLPDQARWAFTFGTSYKKGHWGLDWYAMYLKWNNAHVTEYNHYRSDSTGLPLVVVPVYGQLYPTSYDIVPDGKYKGQAYLYGVSLSYRF